MEEQWMSCPYCEEPFCSCDLDLEEDGQTEIYTCMKCKRMFEIEINLTAWYDITEIEEEPEDIYNDCDNQSFFGFHGNDLKD